jgi:hypothetical protein
VSAWNHHDSAGIDRLIAPDGIHDDIGNAVHAQGPDQVKDFLKSIIAQEPDFNWQIDRFIVSGSTAVAEWTWNSDVYRRRPIWTTGPMGPAKGVSFMGYDPNEKVYTYHEFTSTGEAIDSKGTVSGDTWNWTAESKMGDAKISVRVTIKEVSKTEYTFKLEMSQNGGEFSVVEEATGHKVTAAAPAKKS